MQASYLTLIFVIFIVVDIAIKSWLNIRQIRYIAKHAKQVPSEFAETISLENHQKAARYSLERLRVNQFELLYGTLILLAFTLLGGINWLYAHINQLVSGDIWQGLLLIFITMVINAVLMLPFSIYRTFSIEKKYGFNHITPALFIKDLCLNFILSIVIGGILLTVILWIMASTTAWWLWAWLACMLFFAVMMYISPTWLMPLFNKFTPLQNEELKERINALAERCQFALNGLFVMDSSKRSAHGNAFFTGFGKNRRIIFFDTLLNKLNVDEIEAIMAHELGHFKHKHIIKRMFTMVIASFIFFAILGYVANQAWFYAGLGVLPWGDLSHFTTDPTATSLLLNTHLTGNSHHAVALLLFLFVMPTFTFWLTPLNSWSSRRDEFQADEFASKHSNATALIEALVKLYKDNASTLTPDPVYSAYYDSHPPASIRINHLKQFMQ